MHAGITYFVAAINQFLGRPANVVLYYVFFFVCRWYDHACLLFLIIIYLGPMTDCLCMCICHQTEMISLISLFVPTFACNVRIWRYNYCFDLFISFGIYIYLTLIIFWRKIWNTWDILWCVVNYYYATTKKRRHEM